MKKILILLGIFAYAITYSQDNNKRFVNRNILGKGKIEPLQLSIDAYPFLFFSNGGGGSVGMEFGNWQVGAIGFSVVPPDYIKNTFFENAENIKIRRNNGFELFANYYIRKDRKGIYGGLLGGPEWFVMEDKITGVEETIAISYVVPRLGL